MALITSQKSNWLVYLLRCADGSLYTGVTTDMDRRLNEHNDGVGAKYTRGRGPVKLVWQEGEHGESSAKRREAEVKKLSRQEKLALIGL